MAEINITGDRLNIYGKEVTEDMYSAIDMVLDKIEKQIKKNKEKIRKRRSGSKSRSKNIIAEDALHLDEEATAKIRIRDIEYKPMDVEEAIMQMDLVTNNFLVFTNARTDQVNVLYRRKDGDYGLIQPST
jgi:putative sigma-54 modulation protein